MHVRVVRPDQLSPDDLDDYLARGWFRIGQAMMTCRVVQFDGELRPAIWTRLPLRGHQFGRNSRSPPRMTSCRYWPLMLGSDGSVNPPRIAEGVPKSLSAAGSGVTPTGS